MVALWGLHREERKRDKEKKKKGVKTTKIPFLRPLLSRLIYFYVVFWKDHYSHLTNPFYLTDGPWFCLFSATLTKLRLSRLQTLVWSSFPKLGSILAPPISFQFLSLLLGTNMENQIILGNIKINRWIFFFVVLFNILTFSLRNLRKDSRSGP